MWRRFLKFIMITIPELIWKLFHREKNNPENPWEIYKDYIKVHPGAVVDPVATIKFCNPPVSGKISLEIGRESHIFAHFGLLCKDAKIKIGTRSNLGNVNLACAKEIEIGDDVIMAWGINVLDNDHHSEDWEKRQFDVKNSRRAYIESNGMDLTRYHDWSSVEMKKITIKNKCWIGCNAIILKGVTIGEGSIIGAGSVVTHDIKPWHLAAGNPCREIRPLKRPLRKKGSK